jgi:hypothetical protein
VNFGANRKLNSHDEWQGSDDGTDINLHRNNKMETMHSDAAQDNSAASINTNTIILTDHVFKICVSPWIKDCTFTV